MSDEEIGVAHGSRLVQYGFGFETATKNTMTSNLPSRFSIAATPCAGFTFVGGVDSSLMIIKDLELSEKDVVRFWINVKKTDGCWEWVRSKDTGGYGKFCLTRGGQYNLCMAHRISWVLHNGSIPDGLFVCHKCDNPPCVNPAHLFLGTHTDNVRDMMRKGRARLYPKGIFTGRRPPHGSLNPSSKLTEAKVGQIKMLARPGLFKAIGDKFGVSSKAIAFIYHGQTWRHVSPATKETKQ